MTPTQVFNKFILPHQSAAIGFIVKLTKDRSQSEDILQDVNFRIFKRLTEGTVQFTAQAQAKSFLLKACKNLFFTERTKRSRMTNFSSLYDEDSGMPEFCCQNENLEKSYEVSETLSNVKARIDELEYGEYIMLFSEGYTYAEISARFKVPKGTVKHRIFKHRKKLKK